MRKPSKTIRLGQFESLGLTFRGLKILAIPMTAEGTICIFYDDKEMEARRSGGCITLHRKGEVPTVTPLTDEKLADDFPPEPAQSD